MDDETLDKLPNWLKNVVALAGGVFLLWVLAFDYITSQARDANPRYTIGYVTGTGYVVSSNSHSVAFFTYTVGTTTYHQSAASDLAPGCTRCLVRYAATEPGNFEFFGRTCAPDSIAQAPAQGWTTQPFRGPDSGL